MEVSIQDQLKLENRMLTLGVDKFMSNVKRAEDKGRGADTGYARRLTKELIEPIAECVRRFTERKGAGCHGKYKKYLSMVSPEQAAYLTLRAVFKYFLRSDNVQHVCLEIGRYIEDEAKFSLFNKEHEGYYKTIIDDFKHKGTKNYRYMHRVLTYKANEKMLSWKDWSNTDRIHVGLRMLGIVLDSTDLIEKKVINTKGSKSKLVIAPTTFALEWIKGYNDKASYLYPDLYPCIIEPDPWIEQGQGGYYTPKLRNTVKLVKTRHLKKLFSINPDLKNTVQALNILQSVPWEVNTEVLSILKKVWTNNLGIGLPKSEPITIPPSPMSKEVKKKDMSPDELNRFIEWKREATALYTLESKRVSKCFQVINVMQIATEYSKYNKFWYVYSCDFRGRIYCATSSFSPQGPDFARSLLRFSEGKRVGTNGMYWLKIHGANCFGNDKLSYDDRVKWIDENRKKWLAIAKDPLSNREDWASTDKPWQFLAWCFEYSGLVRDGENFISHLPISLDGSCNGLQHFSAMLRDEVGGKATNLTPSKVPSDIYSEVAKVCINKLKNSTDEDAKMWLKLANELYQGILPRGLTKKSVMTLPYGSTKHSCTSNIYDFLMEEHQEFFPQDSRFRLCVYLTPILWESINEVVIAARSAMDWLQDCAVVLSKENIPCVWRTPLGFIVYQATNRIEVKRIQTFLSGNISVSTKLSVGEWTNQLDLLKQKQGVSPNFVHSMDACHLMSTILLASSKGIKNFAVVHDDYATHAADTEDLQRYIRTAFVKMYSLNDPLTDFKKCHEELGITLPSIPARGKLSIDDILKSKYFFG